jgi:hypothetical protein
LFGCEDPDFDMHRRKRTARHRDRNHALLAGGVLVLICAGSLFIANNVIKSSEHLRGVSRIAEGAMAAKQLSGSGAGDQTGDDYLSTGSILFVPREGNVCRQRVINNRTWLMRDKGYVICDEAVSWNANTQGQPSSPVSRVDAIRSGFSKK